MSGYVKGRAVTRSSGCSSKYPDSEFEHAAFQVKMQRIMRFRNTHASCCCALIPIVIFSRYMDHCPSQTSSPSSRLASSARRWPSRTLTTSAGSTFSPAHRSPPPTTTYPQTPIETVSKKIFGIHSGTRRRRRVTALDRQVSCGDGTEPPVQTSRITRRAYHRPLSSASSRAGRAYAISAKPTLGIRGFEYGQRRAELLCCPSMRRTGGDFLCPQMLTCVCSLPTRTELQDAGRPFCNFRDCNIAFVQHNARPSTRATGINAFEFKLGYIRPRRWTSSLA
ncbi:hypothetical protein FIBSPDRAFT_282272 [Athelia psychrophila]|uniref:Uncharacterized protein n=1 Tax=Athelia psychrophila TaxID=1759441 RepID=A0A167XSK3_9AGAM|nr:hypothetical protein FIBSPDRAFT_282272 [Fibularhizoctonia sp. CBS 109695]